MKCDFDIVISGAGPAGLCLARALSGVGLSIALVEQQPRAALESPSYDGREIALTQPSSQTLRDLGLWARIERYNPVAFSPLRDAKVLNGPSPFALWIGAEETRQTELGWLVSNHLIRRAAFDEAMACRDVSLLAGQAITQARTDAEAASVTLANGQTLRAKLLVAADSRFSSTRRAMGISASMHDFGRSMLLATMEHDEPHHHVAWEWFDHGQTLALLPMNPLGEGGAHRSCLVLTLPHHEVEQLHALDDDSFNADITRRFAHRLGGMRVVAYDGTGQASHHLYPLVGVRPHRLVARRFACVGDAAIGMHPVTAHGFNFGLLGTEALAGNIRAAHQAGRDFCAPDLLARYERTHQRATTPLYVATNAIARLYTDERAPARLLRSAALQLAERFPPFKKAVALSLAG